VFFQNRNVSELYKLSRLIDGAELYSRIEEIENADHYIRVVHEKASQILSCENQSLLQTA